MQNKDYDWCLARLKHSLDLCGLDYIDLYLIHGPQPTKRARLETWRACQEGVKRGWVRSVGVSNFGNHHVEQVRAVGGDVPCVVNQIDLRPPHPPLLPTRRRDAHAREDGQTRS